MMTTMMTMMIRKGLYPVPNHEKLYCSLHLDSFVIVRMEKTQRQHSFLSSLNSKRHGRVYPRSAAYEGFGQSKQMAAILEVSKNDASTNEVRTQNMKVIN